MDTAGLKIIESAILVVNNDSTAVALPKGTYFHITYRPDAKLGETGGGCWIEFGPSAVAVVAATNPAVFVSENFPLIVKAPHVAGVLATHVAAIEAATAGDGHLIVIGLG
jgi:hypothetical protein